MQQQATHYYHDVSQLFQSFEKAPNAVLLDSGKPQQAQGRFDIISAWPSRQLRINDQGQASISDMPPVWQTISFAQLRETLQQSWQSSTSEHAFAGGWIGFASYELAYLLEPHSGNIQNPSDIPAFSAGYYDWAIIQDHQTQSAQLVYEETIDCAKLARILATLEMVAAGKNAATRDAFKLQKPFQAANDYPHYQQCFTQIQDYLRQGDCYQVNFAQQFSAPYQGSAFTAFKRLREAVPSPYMAFLRLGEQAIVSISPERFIQAAGQAVSSKPIKGTTARAKNPAEDAQAAKQLLASTKDRAENIMIVDLIRNDLSRYSNKGSVKVPALCELESFANVHHLVSEVTAEIDNEHDIWDVFFASFPGGSITGAPKIRACQIIQELENFNREIYCGSIFYASNNGKFDASITIRSLLFNAAEVKAWAGGGIVYDSNCADEYQECFNKISHLLRALENYSHE